MRIIAGSAGGIPLRVPPGDTRPTTDRVREALFSMLGSQVEGARVLDLFAGSGSLGLEALSRGAASALFIEQNRAACDVLRGNLQKARLKEGQVRQGEAFRLVNDLARTGQSFDLIFADPPYTHRAEDTDFTQALLTCEALRQVLAPTGLFLLECRAEKRDLSPAVPWVVTRQRDYGTTRLVWLQLPSPATP
jgi:16S rRNA (guanine966-N2)-methyltransferase